MSYTVTLIPGDGIGPDVTTAARRVLEATGVKFNWEIAEAGAAVKEKYGTFPCLIRLSPRSRKTESL
jgi:isocitrate dehydrogenase (NAD+)